MNLTEWQKMAAESTNPLTLVVAGPGSGKTSTLIARLKWLVQRGIDPKEIVAITFTNDAAQEIEKRLQVENSERLGFVGTLHSFMLRLLEKNGQRATVIDEEQVLEIVAGLITQHRWKGSAVAVTEAIALGPFAHSQGTPLDLIRLDYYQQLRRGNMLDFDSILFYGLSFVERSKTLPYSHVLWDEFQDSSLIDAKIFNKLAIPNKFTVGDDCQSLYAFRGGKPSIFIDMLKSEKGLKVVLEQNFRSDIAICEAANRLIAHNQNRFEKKTVAVSQKTGSVEILPHFGSPVLEMNAIASDIAKQSGSIAVLTRTNALAGELASFLEAVGVKVKRKTVKAWPAGWRVARALLSVLANPDNDAAAYRFLKLSESEKKANQFKLQALASFTTINQQAWRYQNTQLSDVSTLFGLHGISLESRHFVEVTIEKLPAKATINDLLIALARDEGREQDQGEGVTVCTIHASKGREFDTVYLPAFEQGIIPSGRADIEEERRCAFVAITRARHRLVITHCQKRRVNQWQKDETATPSQFLSEIQQ